MGAGQRKPDWAQLEHLLEGARRRGFTSEQVEYLASCMICRCGHPAEDHAGRARGAGSSFCLEDGCECEEFKRPPLVLVPQPERRPPSRFAASIADALQATRARNQTRRRGSP